MKRCPTCDRTFTDPNLSFCIDDGTPLVTSVADETTVVSPSPKDQASEQPYKPRDWQTPAYQPPDYQTYPDTKKRKTWPWVVGVFALVIIVFGGLGIAAAIMFPKLLRTTTNRNSNANAPVAASRTPDHSNEPLPTPTSKDNSENDNANADSATLLSTDEAKVLADLTNLEHDWTVANINADKEVLDRILADDYVGVLQNGRNQGKAEYLATIKRDNSVQRWDFEDLKVTLNADRASLTGVIRYEFDEGLAAFQFTDKFVWRNGRWQAVSSQIKQIQ